MGRLVNCKTCGQKVSTGASSCPSCGERKFRRTRVVNVSVVCSKCKGKGEYQTGSNGTTVCGHTYGKKSWMNACYKCNETGKRIEQKTIYDD